VRPGRNYNPLTLITDYSTIDKKREVSKRDRPYLELKETSIIRDTLPDKNNPLDHNDPTNYILVTIPGYGDIVLLRKRSTCLDECMKNPINLKEK